MYICLEGVKGAGKSTILAGVQHQLNERGLVYATVSPMRAKPPGSALEALWRSWKWMRRWDAFVERVYAARYNYAMRRMDWTQPLTLGDRSLITSYVTRWTRWGDPHVCIARVDRSHDAAPAPDHVLYLCTNLETLRARIARRAGRDYGHQDETPERLIDAMNAYEDIRLQRVDVPRLRNTQWHVIETHQPTEQTVQQCVQTILSLLAEGESRAATVPADGDAIAMAPRQISPALRREIAI